MKTKRRDLAIILAFGIILGALVAKEARAGIRVNARILTPHGTIQVVNGPNQRHTARVITRNDRKVAKRLARYAGVKKREILDLRRLGYRWTEIGVWLEVPHRAVQAAQRAHTWSRYMRRHTRLNRCRVPAHPEPNQRRGLDDRDSRW